ncbi:MAG: 50S ribosomal protein L19 [Verrucomicrobia bacterium]|nr:50S ribosomal protein L19 [Verrucomicrobiota bacterium]MBU4290347.1 50S ribosomal protein L19 [Verrucomicrobiota bacterium]MBU4430191.1 50S ribosomal protein L19 [Verrucomicrobiota bacterium]MCG2681477.1 50S ribosomal protein L19 [Kiritimatiellia bacterium]
MKAILDKINKENRNPQGIPLFNVGDTVKISVKIKEGDKERIQAYSGTVIARKGGGATETFTVRRISFGEGVERVFCVHSPNIAKIEVEGSSHVRRAKLYYLRKLTGKNARLKKMQEALANTVPVSGTATIAQV